MLTPSLLMVPSVLGLALCLGVSWALWKRRPEPAWRYATITGMAVAVWCVGQIAWLLTDDSAARQLITRFQYVGVAISPTMWLMTGLAYVGQRDWLRGRRRRGGTRSFPSVCYAASWPLSWSPPSPFGKASRWPSSPSACRRSTWLFQ